MFPVLCVVEGFLLGHLLHLDRPAAAPWLSFGLAVVVTADVVAACKAARKLSDHHKEQHAGGTPALPGAITPPLRGSRRSRAVRRRLMRWGGSLGLGQERFKARDCSWMEANSWRFSDSLAVCR